MGVMVNDGTGTNLCSSSQTVEEGLNWKLKADDGPELRAPLSPGARQGTGIVNS